MANLQEVYGKEMWTTLPDYEPHRTRVPNPTECVILPDYEPHPTTVTMMPKPATWTTLWKPASEHKDVASLVKNLMYNSSTRALAERNGLQISSVAWEDTGRTKGSCFGPNISDMTLCVNGQEMPIIRKPNFADVTSDQAMDMFTVNIGNEGGRALRAISLREYLANITTYTDVKVKGSLVADRDTHILTSAQSCVLPLQGGKVEFGVKLYNYQSQTEPAVLVVVASAQGTSTHVVLGHDNVLRFNKAGKMADFVAERLKEDRARRGVATNGAMTEEEKQRNAVLIYQIPLVYRARPMRSFGYCDSMVMECCAASASLQNFAGERGTRSASMGMDHAVISTTEGRGVFPSLSKWTIERDTRMPIRCTIQYYHVTDTDTIQESEMAQIAAEVTKHSPIGSLVVDGSTARPTEHTVPGVHRFIGQVTSLFGFL